MKKIYIVKRESNVKGDTGHEIVSCHENYSDACSNLADEVKTDMQFCGWFEQCGYSEARDEKDREIVSEALPDKLSYFLIQETEEWQGDYYEEYHICETILYPSSSDSMSEK